MKITKLVLWITALVLIVALGFSVNYISVKGSAGGTTQVASKQVKNTQKFTDGLPREGLFKYETKISNEGTHRITIDPKISPAYCVIGSEIYDSSGKLLGAAVLFDGEEVKLDYKFTEGTCSFLFRYITSEQDFRDFVEEYDAIYNADSVSQALKKANFSKFKENGTVSVSCKVTLAKVKSSSVDYADIFGFIGICNGLLAVLIILGFLYKQKKPAEPELYDGKAPEIPVPPAPQPKANPQPVYQQPAQQATWVCGACGERENTGRFCANCGQPRPFMPAAYQAPVYQMPYQAPAYQLPAYTVPAQPQYQMQPYQVPVTYQPVQYAQPVFAPVPAPVQPVYQQPAYQQQAQIPDYSAKPKKPEPEPADPEFVDELKNRIPAVASRYAAFCVLFLLVQFAGALLLAKLVPDVVKQYRTSISFGLIVLAVDAIGFPFIWLLMRGIPKTKLEVHKLSFSEWFGFLMITEALILAGSLVGNSIHTALTQPFSGESLTKASNLMQNSNVIVRTLVVGIGAPVFEELIFRKVLIDRTIKYGEYVSIVMSGLMFGLLHGNFQQFFFAALVGFLFAYVYIRTGRIRYSIFLHMAINLSSSLVLQTLLQKLIAAREEGTDHSLTALLCAVIIFAWVGGVLAIGIIGIVRLIKGLKRKKLALNLMKGEPSHKEVRSILWKDKGMWLYVAMCIILFLHSYLPNIILFVLNKIG